MNWPILPRFLSKYVPDGEQYTPNTHGLFESDTLRGFIVDASDDKSIKNPLSLFQVVPSRFPLEKESNDRIESLPTPESTFLSQILGSDRKIIRIDPRNLYPNMTCCDKFREYLQVNNQCNLCYEQDSQILLLYHSALTNINYTTEFDKYKAQVEALCSEYNDGVGHSNSNSTLNVGYSGRRLYIWYKCRYSNFYEYFFPIIHAGRVVAVLMQGQRPYIGMDYSDIFSDYRDQSEELEKSIKSIAKSRLQDPPMSEERLNAIYEKISILEQRIEQEVLSYARTYISNKFSEIQRDFRIELQHQTDSDGRMALERYSYILDNALRNVCGYFNPNGFIRIYTAESALEASDRKKLKFYLIGTSETTKRNTIIREITFAGIEQKDFDKISNYDLASYTTPLVELKNGDVFRIEPLQVGGMRNLIWKNYNRYSHIDELQFELYGEALRSLYHMLLEPYHILKTIELQERMEVSMRVSVHEAANIIPTIYNRLNKEYKFNDQTLDRLRDGMGLNAIKNRERSLYDAIQRLLLLNSLYRRSTLIFKDSQPIFKWTDIHRTIYSVETLFAEPALENKYQKIIILMDPVLNRYDFLTDAGAFNHILFNLVDNAVKYGHRGSKIYIKAEVPHEQQHYLPSFPEKVDTIIISVVNYGFKIKNEDRDKMFELYYRSEQSKSEEGRGIGLFLVDKLCSALGYNIENNRSSFIAKYHIPAKYYFNSQDKCQQYLTYVSPEIISRLEMQTPDEHIQKVVNNQNDIEWKIGPREITELMNTETYENVFTITIKAPCGKTLLQEIQR